MIFLLIHFCSLPKTSFRLRSQFWVLRPITILVLSLFGFCPNLIFSDLSHAFFFYSFFLTIQVVSFVTHWVFFIAIFPPSQLGLSHIFVSTIFVVTIFLSENFLYNNFLSKVFLSKLFSIWQWGIQSLALVTTVLHPMVQLFRNQTESWLRC